MKYLLNLLFIILLIFSCSTEKVQENFIGTITLASGKIDSVYIGLYSHNSYNRNSNWASLFEPIYFTAIAGNKFSFNADPGRYTLVAFAYGYEPIKKRVFIPDQETFLMTSIKLVPIGIQPEIKNIELVGDFCDWKNGKAFVQNQKNKKWIIGSELPIKVDGTYQFLVDGVPRNDLSNKNYILRKNHADFVNVYKGDSIEFNPKFYAKTIEKSSTEITGYNLLKQYNQVCNDIIETKNKLYFTHRDIQKSEQGEWEQKYNRIIDSFESIKKKYDSTFHQLIIEEQLFDLFSKHPIYYDLSKAYNYGSLDTLYLLNILKRQKFQEFFKYELQQVNSLDPKSNLLRGNFYFALTRLDFYIKLNPDLKTKYNLADDHFYNFIINFVKKSPNKTLCSHLLFQAANCYNNLGEKEKVKFLINLLKNEYADDFYVGNGYADELLGYKILKVGMTAPDFMVSTLNGIILKLSNFKGKFIFIDFWYTSCPPCRAELPNIKKLAQSISKDKFQIIGLANDNEIKLREFLNIDPLPYQNAIVPEEVLKAYGITNYPTTFLLDPEGKILAKDLRGEKLVELVRNKMNNYKH